MEFGALKRFALFLLLLAIGWWFAVSSESRRRSAAEEAAKSSTNLETVAPGVVATITATPSAAPPGQPTPLLGETILRDYAKPSLPPENDLKLLSHLMDNFNLLVKSAADMPMSANEDWAAAFRGSNPAHERFLPDQHAALNAQGQLVDRWGTPLFFHALGDRRFELRSAGPDKKMWTADDIHRNADGSFRHGADLNPPSLLDASRQSTAP